MAGVGAIPKSPSIWSFGAKSCDSKVRCFQHNESENEQRIIRDLKTSPLSFTDSYNAFVSVQPGTDHCLFAKDNFTN